MITNAAILRLDLPAGASSGGDVVWQTGAAVAVRCAMAAPDAAEEYPADAAEQRAGAKMTVLKKPLAAQLTAAGYPAGTIPAAGCRVTVRIDDSLEIVYRVRGVANQQKGFLSHWQCDLKSE